MSLHTHHLSEWTASPQPDQAQLVSLQTLIGDLHAQMTRHQALLAQVGIAPTLFCRDRDQLIPASEPVLSQMILERRIQQAFCLSLLSKAQLKQTYLSRRDGDKDDNIFREFSLLDALSRDIHRYRQRDCRFIFQWLRRAAMSQPSPCWPPMSLRLNATPDLGIRQRYPRFRTPHAYENLNLVHAALVFLSGATPPKQLIGDEVCAVWSKQYQDGYQQAEESSHTTDLTRHRSGLRAVSSATFHCRFLNLKAYKTAPDRITFYPNAQKIIAQYHVKPFFDRTPS